MVQVTTWSRRIPDFTPGRWVQLGKPSLINFWMTGLPGGKMYISRTTPYIRYESCKVKFENYATTWIDKSQLEIPRGLGADGWIKALFGQRRIKQPS